METKKARVSEQALIKRINRKLASEGNRLCKCRSGRWSSDLGYYYIGTLDGKSVVASHQKLAELGREVGALRSWEELG